MTRVLHWVFSTVAAIACVASVAADQSAAKPSADSLLRAAARQAAAEHKGILVVFGASWCPPCRELDAFLDAPEVSQALGRHYVIVPMTVFEQDDKMALNTPGAEPLFNSLSGDGIPLIAFLDSNGRTVATWNDGGIPDAPARAKFAGAFADHAPDISAADRASLTLALKHGLGVYSVAGAVFDASGRAVAGADVSIVSGAYKSTGLWTPVWGPRTRTDGDGRYTLDGVKPGDYQISVNATTGVQIMPISLRPHEDRTGVDIRLGPIATTRVAGVVYRANGQPAAHETVTIANLDRPALAYDCVSGGDGRFVLEGVSPGRYNAAVTVSSSSSGIPSEAVVQPLFVAKTPVDSLKITTLKAGRLSGTVTLAGGHMTPAERAALRVVAAAVEPEPGAPAAAVKAGVGIDGRFTLTGLFGRRVLHVEGLPAGWQMESARISTTTNAAKWPTDFTGLAPVEGARIVLAARAAKD